MTHSFAVCAYGDSPYLERCLRSLAGQTVSSEKLLCTATPSLFLERLAAQYGFRYCVRDGEPGIGADWNFALHQASGDFVTLAHQDDVYARHYAETLYRTAAAYPDLTLFTTDARILRDGRIQPRSKAEFVKKLLRVPLRLPLLSTCTAGKRLSLRFGNPIVCPSCAYRRGTLFDLAPLCARLGAALAARGGGRSLGGCGAEPVTLPDSQRRGDRGAHGESCAGAGRESHVPDDVAGSRHGTADAPLPECLCGLRGVGRGCSRQLLRDSVCLRRTASPGTAFLRSSSRTRGRRQCSSRPRLYTCSFSVSIGFAGEGSETQHVFSCCSASRFAIWQCAVCSLWDSAFLC